MVALIFLAVALLAITLAVVRWRRRRARVQQARAAEETERRRWPPRPPKILHGRLATESECLCGAPLTDGWTVIFDTVTCVECRRIGEPIWLQYWVNTR